MVKIGMVTVDTTDARALAGWWAERLGGSVMDQHDGWFCMVTAPDTGVVLGFQKIDDPTPGKNRLHFDIERDAGTDREALVAEWVSAGATHLGQRGDDAFHWDTFADPDGNEFCIAGGH